MLNVILKMLGGFLRFMEKPHEGFVYCSLIIFLKWNILIGKSQCERVYTYMLHLYELQGRNIIS